MYTTDELLSMVAELQTENNELKRTLATMDGSKYSGVNIPITVKARMKV